MPHDKNGVLRIIMDNGDENKIGIGLTYNM